MINHFKVALRKTQSQKSVEFDAPKMRFLAFDEDAKQFCLFEKTDDRGGSILQIGAPPVGPAKITLIVFCVIME